ncbi:MAG: hypothetical protein CM1200mP13_03010 [Candidatus Pelagibacterales bacterium]|nr:MAG: hypothetical protein CM1200mP13_03010 [Pelagibacterales bacterium]
MLVKICWGQELWDELTDDFGTQSFAAGNTGVQMGGWFNKKIRSANDFKGLKMRMPGLGGQVLGKLVVLQFHFLVDKFMKTLCRCN